MCFEKLSELYKPMSQEKINKEFWKKKMWRHIRHTSKGERTLKSKTSCVAGAGDLVPSSAGRSDGGGDTSFQKLLRARLGGGSDYEPRTWSVETEEINCGASLPNMLL